MTIQTMGLVGLQAHPHLENSTAYRQLRPTKLDDRQNHLRDVARPSRLARVCHCKMITRAALLLPMLAARRRPASGRPASARTTAALRHHHTHGNQAPFSTVERLLDSESKVLLRLRGPALALCGAAFLGVAEPQHEVDTVL